MPEKRLMWPFSKNFTKKLPIKRSDFFLIDIYKELNLDIHESVFKDEYSQRPNPNIADDEKSIETEEKSRLIEENLPMDETDTDKEIKRLANDQVNILHCEGEEYGN